MEQGILVSKENEKKYRSDKFQEIYKLMKQLKPSNTEVIEFEKFNGFQVKEESKLANQAIALQKPYSKEVKKLSKYVNYSLMKLNDNFIQSRYKVYLKQKGEQRLHQIESKLKQRVQRTSILGFVKDKRREMDLK